MNSNKPYLIRAIYQWIIDNNQTPYVLIDCSFPGVIIPEQFIKNKTVVLNISPAACSNFVSNNNLIKFSASFSGKVFNISFAPEAIMAIYSHECGEGMRFEVDHKNYHSTNILSTSSRRSNLRLIEK